MKTDPIITIAVIVGAISNEALDQAEANIRNIKKMLGMED